MSFTFFHPNIRRMFLPSTLACGSVIPLQHTQDDTSKKTTTTRGTEGKHVLAPLSRFRFRINAAVVVKGPFRGRHAEKKQCKATVKHKQNNRIVRHYDFSHTRGLHKHEEKQALNTSLGFLMSLRPLYCHFLRYTLARVCALAVGDKFETHTHTCRERWPLFRTNPMDIMCFHFNINYPLFRRTLIEHGTNMAKAGFLQQQKKTPESPPK